MPALIIGTTYCRYTQRAVIALPSAEVVYLDERQDQEQVHLLLRTETGHTTLPYIFAADGSFVGGYDDIDRQSHSVLTLADQTHYE